MGAAGVAAVAAVAPSTSRTFVWAKPEARRAARVLVPVEEQHAGQVPPLGRVRALPEHGPRNVAELCVFQGEIASDCALVGAVFVRLNDKLCNSVKPRLERAKRRVDAVLCLPPEDVSVDALAAVDSKFNGAVKAAERMAEAVENASRFFALARVVRDEALEVRDLAGESESRQRMEELVEIARQLEEKTNRWLKRGIQQRAERRKKTAARKLAAVQERAVQAPQRQIV